MRTSFAFFRRARSTVLAGTLAIGSAASFAQLPPPTQPVPALAAPAKTAQAVKVERAWVRARLAGQDATAGYLQLTARDNARLVGATTTAAGSVELHEMKMDGDVMRMRAAPAIELPAGQAVQLKPGGAHLMLLDLKTPLANNTSMPLTLIFQGADGREIREELQVPVLTSEPAADITGPARPATKQR